MMKHCRLVKSQVIADKGGPMLSDEQRDQRSIWEIIGIYETDSHNPSPVRRSHPVRFCVSGGSIRIKESDWVIHSR
jgi:hypothetical protein